jgi:sugar/nucleoside kinase (ribokinase family)
MFQVVSLGDSCQDIFLMLEPDQAELHCTIKPDDCQISFHYADKIPIATKLDAVGGNAANAAVSFAKLGLKTALYTHVAEDRPGVRIRDELKLHGVAEDFIVVDQKSETNYNTVISYKGERTIFSYHQHRQYHLPQLGNVPWVYLTSMKNGFETMLPDLLQVSRQHGTKIAYQPGSYQLKLGAKAVRELLENTSILFLNREEAEGFLEVSGSPSFSELLSGLQKLGPQMVVVTDGSNGTAAADGHEQYYMPVLADVEKKEATGAGDAFASATAAGLMSGLRLREALRWGQLQAAGVIQQVGAQAGLLTKSQLDEGLLKHPNLVAVNLDPKL